MKQYYAVQFIKPRGRVAHINKVLDVVHHSWLKPVVTGKGTKLLEAYFPSEPANPEINRDLRRRLKGKLPPDENWPLWPVKIRGRSGKVF